MVKRTQSGDVGRVNPRLRICCLQADDVTGQPMQDLFDEDSARPLKKMISRSREQPDDDCNYVDART